LQDFLLSVSDPTPYKKNSDPLKRHCLSSTNQGRAALQDDSNCRNFNYFGHSDGGFLKDKPNNAI